MGSAGAVVIGILNLNIFKGELVRDTEAFGKMDPYVRVD